MTVSCAVNGFTGFVSGPYRYTDISGIDAGFTIGSSSGTVVYDGAGSYSGGYVLNNSGVISSGSISGSYTAAVGGALTVHDGYSGAVSADGNTIVSLNLQAGHEPSVDVEIKQGQTNFTNADFSGIYQVVSVSSIDDSSSTLTLTADGVGSYSGKLVQNNSDVITSSAVSGAYSVAADGSLTITPASGSPLSGGISADGKMLVLSQLTAGQPSAFAVGIKQGQTNFTNADVVGRYNIVNYSGPTFYIAEILTLDFDGAGNFKGPTITNSNFAISESAVEGTYTVTADGTLTMEFNNSCPMPVTVDWCLPGGSAAMAIRWYSNAIACLLHRGRRRRGSFVACHDGAARVSGFALDASTGTLTPISGSPFLTDNRPEYIAMF